MELSGNTNVWPVYRTAVGNPNRIGGVGPFPRSANPTGTMAIGCVQLSHHFEMFGFVP
jgi:hypothetical protein